MAQSHEERLAYYRNKSRRERAAVVKHYGGRCVCCGEQRPEFLALDHKDGNGEQHRLAIRRRGGAMVRWIIKNDFPPLFQVLCHNCNQAMGLYGVCPHAQG